MDILRLRPIISHVRVKLSCDNYRQGKFGKFIKSKFKILTCVVLLGRLNTMRGISAGEYEHYDEGNMSRGNIYFYQLYIYCLCLVFPCYIQNHHQLSRHFIFAFKICFDQIFVVVIFLELAFNRRCSYDQAVFSKLMPRIFLCSRPYDITASWQKAFHFFLNPTHSFKNHPLSTSSCSYLNLWFSQ